MRTGRLLGAATLYCLLGSVLTIGAVFRSSFRSTSLYSYSSTSRIPERKAVKASCSAKARPVIETVNLNRHSPDDAETSVESSDFAASLEARREIWLATSSSGSPNDGRGVDLAIFTGIWTHSSCRLRLNACPSNASCWRGWWLRP